MMMMTMVMMMMMMMIMGFSVILVEIFFFSVKVSLFNRFPVNAARNSDICGLTIDRIDGHISFVLINVPV